MEDPKKKLQEANGLLRNAQNNMFSGKNTEAVELLNKAEDLGREAESQIPDDFQLRSLFQKIEKMRKDLERKGVATRAGGNSQLPFEVQAQLNRIRDHVIKKELKWARKEMDTFYAKYAGSYTHLPELEEYKQHILKLEAEEQQLASQKAGENQAQEQAKEQARELSKQWSEKLRAVPYFDGTSRSVDALLQEQNAYRQAQEVITAYKAVSFPAQPSITLESMARDIETRIREFPSKLAQTLQEMAQQITQSIEDRIDFLNQDTAWQNQPEGKPYVISTREMDQFTSQVEELRPLFADQPSGMESMTNALQQLTEMNMERKNERSKLTVMKPEAITGPQAEEAINTAMMALAQKYPDARVIKSAAIRPWEHKRTEEWADTTKTQWVVKNTNETTVQICAELTSDNCKLFTLHVEKDINTDGTYGKPRSHIMHEEMMANPTVV